MVPLSLLLGHLEEMSSVLLDSIVWIFGLEVVVSSVAQLLVLPKVRNGVSLSNRGCPIISVFRQSQKRATNYATSLLAYLLMLSRISLVKS